MPAKSLRGMCGRRLRRHLCGRLSASLLGSPGPFRTAAAAAAFLWWPLSLKAALREADAGLVQLVIGVL